ncbi:MAG: acyclic terpene utilization AtuA family protein [Bacteroidales bacterium]
MKPYIRIGNAGGFWGDDLTAFRRQLMGGPLDYISIDFLAEITMSILRKQQLKNPQLGYVTDFLPMISENAREIYHRKVKVLTNAGGINPLECGRQVTRILREQEIPLKVAVVLGDNIIQDLEAWKNEGIDFRNMENGRPFTEVAGKIQSANAYIGMWPLVKALEMGADIVIAGRVTDTSITMAPMAYEFGWKPDDFDRIASALVAGHIIECGAQVTGGNYTDWHKVTSWENMAYPIVEVRPDGTFTVTRHPRTGGLVNMDTVREQLVYEMGNPAAYISPDVIADFRTIHLEEEGPDRVRVSGIKGYPPTPFLKVSMAYQEGYVSSGSIIISAPAALEKARTFADIFWKRIGVPFTKAHTAYQGYNSCHLNLAPDNEPNEVLLTFSIYDEDLKKHDLFAKSIAPLILSGPPGVAVTGGRPHIKTVLSYWPALIPKEKVTARILMLDTSGETLQEFQVRAATGHESSYNSQDEPFPQVASEGMPIVWGEGKKVRLYELCLARSGDKGDTANIGLLARTPAIYDWIKQHITASFVKYLFREICQGRVVRYELNNLLGLNFLLEESLDGGGTRSLMADPQGKTFAQALLNVEVVVPEDVIKEL